MYEIKGNMDKVECMYLADKLTSSYEEVGDSFWIENVQSVLSSAIHEGSKENLTLEQVVNSLMNDNPSQIVERLSQSENKLTMVLINPLVGTSDKTIQSVFALLRSLLTKNKKLPTSAN